MQKQARDTAYMYGLTDRGTLEVGKKADINIVDMTELKILDPVHVYDMPTGAPRWDQKCVGYLTTIQSGVVTFRNGTSAVTCLYCKAIIIVPRRRRIDWGAAR